MSEPERAQLDILTVPDTNDVHWSFVMHSGVSYHFPFCPLITKIKEEKSSLSVRHNDTEKENVNSFLATLYYSAESSVAILR